MSRSTVNADAGTASASSACSSPPSSLAQQVAKLEREAADLSDLCGLIIATIRVNWLRGQLTLGQVDDPKAAREKFEKMLDDWSAARLAAGSAEAESNHNIRQTDFRNTARKESE